jgi:hypothetical protein
VLANPASPSKDRAVALMGLGLAVIWIVIGGLVQLRYRERICAFVASIKWDWRLKFVLFCTLLALLEEVVTTSMTNLAPFFGTTPEEAHITASTNYFIVVAFHSVVVFVPMFVGWAYLLSKWDFRPLETFLCIGLMGSIAEAGINPSSLIAGFWFFVYGLFVYLPAYSAPSDRLVPRPKWYHYFLTIIIPWLFSIPVIVGVVLLRRALGIQFLPGVPN